MLRAKGKKICQTWHTIKQTNVVVVVVVYCVGQQRVNIDPFFYLSHPHVFFHPRFFSSPDECYYSNCTAGASKHATQDIMSFSVDSQTFISKLQEEIRQLKTTETICWVNIPNLHIRGGWNSVLRPVGLKLHLLQLHYFHFLS